MVVEIFVCLYFAVNCGQYSCFIKDNVWTVAFGLLLPQICIFLFCAITELVLLVVCVYWFSSRNDRPYIIASLEFIYVFLLWGITDLFCSPLFDRIIEFAMKKIQKCIPSTSEVKAHNANEENKDMKKDLRNRFNITEQTKAFCSHK